MIMSREEFPLMDLVYVLMGLSHVFFGYFALEHRYNKIISIGLCAIYLGAFLGICYIPIPVIYIFLLTLVIGLIMSFILSGLPWYKTLFVFTSYTVVFTIFLGCCFGLTLIEAENALLLKGLSAFAVYVLLQVIVYVFLMPIYKKASKGNEAGWVRYCFGNILFMALFFMEAVYPFQVQKATEGGLIAFVITIFTYFFVYYLVFLNAKANTEILETKQDRQHFIELAKTDQLTSLLNKISFEEYVEELTDNYKNNVLSNISLIILDIDKFKSINDTFGHLEGDETLKHVSIILKEVFYESNYKIFRFGGDEFVVVALNVEHSDLVDKVKELNTETKTTHNLTISAGISNVDFNNISPFRTAIKTADKRMYKNKFR